MTVSLVHVIYTSQGLKFSGCTAKGREGLKTAEQQAMIPGSMLSSSLDTRPRGRRRGRRWPQIVMQFSPPLHPLYVNDTQSV